jgi:hypothetical protein
MEYAAKSKGKIQRKDFHVDTDTTIKEGALHEISGRSMSKLKHSVDQLGHYYYYYYYNLNPTLSDVEKCIPNGKSQTLTSGDFLLSDEAAIFHVTIYSRLGTDFLDQTRSCNPT